MYDNIDYESLRKDLINYFGSATPLFAMSIIDLSKIEYASNYELINIAINNGFDLSEYKLYSKTKNI